MQSNPLAVLKGGSAQIVDRGRKEVSVRPNHSAARHHLEEAYRLLPGNDELSVKSRQALSILIDAMLAQEFSAEDDSAKVIEFPRRVRSGNG